MTLFVNFKVMSVILYIMFANKHNIKVDKYLINCINLKLTNKKMVILQKDKKKMSFIKSKVKK